MVKCVGAVKKEMCYGEWRTTTRADRRRVTAHEVTVGDASVTKAKTGQGSFPATVSVSGERPWENCGLDGMEFVINL